MKRAQAETVSGALRTLSTIIDAPDDIAEVSGAGTASAGLPGYTASDKE